MLMLPLPQISLVGLLLLHFSTHRRGQAKKNFKKKGKKKTTSNPRPSPCLQVYAIVISNGFIIVVAAADLACNKFQDDAAITANSNNINALIK